MDSIDQSRMEEYARKQRALERKVKPKTPSTHLIPSTHSAPKLIKDHPRRKSVLPEPLEDHLSTDSDGTEASASSMENNQILSKLATQTKMRNDEHRKSIKPAASRTALLQSLLIPANLPEKEKKHGQKQSDLVTTYYSQPSIRGAFSEPSQPSYQASVSICHRHQSIQPNHKNNHFYRLSEHDDAFKVNLCRCLNTFAILAFSILFRRFKLFI